MIDEYFRSDWNSNYKKIGAFQNSNIVTELESCIMKFSPLQLTKSKLHIFSLQFLLNTKNIEIIQNWCEKIILWKKYEQNSEYTSIKVFIKLYWVVLTSSLFKQSIQIFIQNNLFFQLWTVFKWQAFLWNIFHANFKLPIECQLKLFSEIILLFTTVILNYKNVPNCKTVDFPNVTICFGNVDHETEEDSHIDMV